MNLPIEFQIIGVVILLVVAFVAIGLFSAWVSNLAHARAERQASRWRMIAAQQVEHFNCRCALEEQPIITHGDATSRGELLRRMTQRKHNEEFEDELEEPK